MWRLVALDIVFHLHSIRDFSIRLDKDWSVLQPTRASWFLLYASLRRFISLTLQRRQCKLWTQNQPVRLWQRWGYGAKETMSISGCIQYVKEGKLPLCCLFVQVWPARWICRNRASLLIDQPSRALTSPAAKITSVKAEPPTAPIHHRSFYGSHLRINTAGKCVSMCVCYICDVWKLRPIQTDREPQESQ